MEDIIYKLETNIDDSSGELLGRVMDLLLKAGALDVFFTPIIMKKNRPATLLSVLCREDQAEHMEDILFHETSTIGIRRQRMERRILPRKEGQVSLPYGQVLTKDVTLPDGSLRSYPEYDSAAALAKQAGLPLWQVMADFYKAVSE